MALRTEYEFILPRGYLDETGTLHKRGTMRLATARDELEPLRDPFISGPDDPRLTILVLARVVRTLGTVELITTHEIEGLFAADLAYLQDFYGVINFGTPEEIEALLAAQDEAAKGQTPAGRSEQTTVPAAPAQGPALGGSPAPESRPAEVPSLSRRAAIQEVPSSGA
ncbi:MAG TPA: hypothetical protein VFN68_03060 [Acidimicrobiales bacterium]|nr:hypothetical protein [Acidimicrobiales bacterium]